MPAGATCAISVARGGIMRTVITAVAVTRLSAAAFAQAPPRAYLVRDGGRRGRSRRTSVNLLGEVGVRMHLW